VGVEIADKTKRVGTCGEAKSGRVQWICQVCGSVLPKRSGPKQYCGRCSIKARLERNTKWNKSEKGKASRHRYYLEHKEHLREVIRLWRENNPERYRAITRKASRKASKNYRKTHSEHCRDYKRQYNLDHSEHVKAQRHQRWLTLHK
jgi:uncharacterized Zn finger protein (UPF0148 family)